MNNVKHNLLGAHRQYTGKTAVSVALSHIFGFAHTQSDDVRACKKPGPVFVRNVMGLLETHDVVIADKFDSFIYMRTHLAYHHRFKK